MGRIYTPPQGIFNSNSVINVAPGSLNTGPSGVFGTGRVEWITVGGKTSFVVPDGITAIRVRIFGWGKKPYFVNTSNTGSSGDGGGFTMKTINGLTSGTAIPITMPSTQGVVSFGNHCSVKVAADSTFNGTIWMHDYSIGVGGDINRKGGKGYYFTSGTSSYVGGGGVGNYFGDGGSAFPGAASNSGTSGAGGFVNSSSYYGGGVGLTGISGEAGATNGSSWQIQTNATPSGDTLPIDYIGTGSGGSYYGSGWNGGGGGAFGNGGFPGGGTGSNGGVGGEPLIIVEY